MVFGSNMYPTKSAQHISSDTKDPSTAHMRVFVGNINTAGLDKSDLQQRFCKYGFVTGISIHRGYAFVQYNSSIAARRAADMENGSMITDQIADVNIAAEPKPNQKPFIQQANSSSSASNVGGGMVPSFEMNNMNNGGDYQNYVRDFPPSFGFHSNSYSHVPKVRTPGGAMRGGMKMSGGGKTVNSHNRTTNKAVHSGRVVKTNSASNKSAVKTNAKTLVSSVVNLSAVRRELVEIRDKINSLLFSINKSGGLGIDQQNISFDISETNNFNNGDATGNTKVPPQAEEKEDDEVGEMQEQEEEEQKVEEESADDVQASADMQTDTPTSTTTTTSES